MVGSAASSANALQKALHPRRRAVQDDRIDVANVDAHLERAGRDTNGPCGRGVLALGLLSPALRERLRGLEGRWEPAALAEQLGPALAPALRRQLAQERELVVESMLPMVGDLVQRAVGDAIQDLAAEVNSQVRRSLDGRLLAFRLRLWLSAAGPNAVPGDVQTVTFLGSVVRSRVKIGAHMLDIDALNNPQHVPPAAGDRVWVRVPADALLVIA